MEFTFKVGENNNEKWADHKDSLGHAISIVSHPFNTLQEKIDCVMQKWNNATNLTIDEKKKGFMEWFKNYFDNEEKFNYYGLFVPRPWES